MKTPVSSRTLLDATYTELKYTEGLLLDACLAPANVSQEDWLEKGDWLALAYKIGAEKVFFVNNEPVIVFHEFQETPSEDKLLETLRRTWCMARPQHLFIALPGDLRVYSLNQPPPKSLNEWQILERVRSVAEVAQRLKKYRREQYELYRVVDETPNGIEWRADQRLIRDLKIVRNLLLDTGLKPRYAHSLIGRSIFIRYLEDREILTLEYFAKIAKRNPLWENLLAEESEKPDFAILSENRRFDRVLRNKDFTYALFQELANDFNGDMFPRSVDEEQAVEQKHLDLLRGFLLGDTLPGQPALFFWAYDFEVIPIELISNIYEEFYHANNNVDDKGTHYTPSALVEFVLSNTLTIERLVKLPRVLDPACGSGIFLVESYRRMIRVWIQQHGGQLPSPEDLRNILRSQIVGVELNEEAVHVAAFSLYLALLHYQNPPDIMGKRLPNLIYRRGQAQDDEHYHILFQANTFGLTAVEKSSFQTKWEQSPSFAGRSNIQTLLNAELCLKLELNSFDVVIGNPPWDQIGENNPAVSCVGFPVLNSVPKPFIYNAQWQTLTFSQPITDEQAEKALDQVPAEYHPLITQLKIKSDECYQPLRWATAHHLPTGDNSYSQLYIYRCLSLVKPGGVIGLLVHSSTILNQRTTTKDFRQKWLASSQLLMVVNFTDVRRYFFKQAVAPFIFASFESREPSLPPGPFVYINARHTKAAKLSRSVILTKDDRRIVQQNEIELHDHLWKTYRWGNHRDAALLARLEMEPRLGSILNVEDPQPGFGFQRGKNNPSNALRQLRVLKSEPTTWYGPLKDEWFEDNPTGVKRDPDESLYRGQRIVVAAGIKKDGVCVRLEFDDFAFRHIFYSVPLPSFTDWQAKVIAGIFWSSLGKYRLFMTSPQWGTWHDKINSSDILSMPIRMPEQKNALAEEIIGVVDKIRSWNPAISGILTGRTRELPPPKIYMDALDNAVFKLFELSVAEQDLIKDFNDYKFPLFRDGPSAKGMDRTTTKLKNFQGTAPDLGAVERNFEQELENYLSIFLRIWNRELNSLHAELSWRVIRPKSVAMLALVFTAQSKDTLSTFQAHDTTEQEWYKILTELDQTLKQPISHRIYIDGIVRAVTESNIIIIKRDEQRLWTRSNAREDAEATILQEMQRQVIQ